MNRLRVLVAEDHSAMRDCIVNILSKDFEVIEAVSNGEDLVAAAVTHNPDIIVSDVCMPRLGGVHALLRLRAADVLIPFVLVTTDEELVSRVKLPLACCISKADMPRRLNAAVRQIESQKEVEFSCS
jgi:DNA-binding NarL/FixJ family response regulator